MALDVDRIGVDGVWYRHLPHRGSVWWRSERPTDQLPRDLWRFGVEAEGIADLRGEAQLARVGLAVPLPRRHGWPAFQEVGEQLYAEGWKGVRAPSAARPGNGEILCLFREGEKLDGVKPVHRPPSSEIRHASLPPDRLSPLRRGSTTAKRPCPNTATASRP